MHDQPKYTPYEPATFFADSARRAGVEGTVAQGQLHEDELLYTGRVDGQPATMFPFPVDDAVMQRGRERYDIYCSPCHGLTGDGDGMIVQRGYRRPPSFHIDRLRAGAARALLRRHHERLRRDARLRRAGSRARPLGDRRLHPRAAAEPERDRAAELPPAAQGQLPMNAMLKATGDRAAARAERAAAQAAARGRRRRGRLRARARAESGPVLPLAICRPTCGCCRSRSARSRS